MYLLDTNIFLEILLGQSNKGKCKNFLVSNPDKIFISDFSLHSIGVILLRNKKANTFQEFIKDILPKIKILSLPSVEYQELTKSADKLKLDFDDLYQYCIAKHFELHIVTMDSDFNNVKDIKIEFL